MGGVEEEGVVVVDVYGGGMSRLVWLMPSAGAASVWSLLEREVLLSVRSQQWCAATTSKAG